MIDRYLSMKDEEIDQLLEKIFDKYGFDFREYARASFKRRLGAVLRAEHIVTISELEQRVLTEPTLMHRFVHSITVSTTSMFRDPTFYGAFRNIVLPVLRTYPFVRFWHAGCATGEEVYSYAILLQEEALADRCRIYATDIDAVSVEKAKAGVFNMSSMKEYSTNYIQAGGKYSLSNYYTAMNEHAVFSKALRENIVFAQHNLVSDSSFNEFHVILCRNVMIYFNNQLREKVLSLFHDSLCPFGILGLGSKESLRFTSIDPCYEQLVAGEQLYRRVI
ncbi:MAG TPA: protein-glutamate O-methyltransferase CheR [Oculatellaceae cyanobacterium]